MVTIVTFPNAPLFYRYVVFNWGSRIVQKRAKIFRNHFIGFNLTVSMLVKRRMLLDLKTETSEKEGEYQWKTTLMSRSLFHFQYLNVISNTKNVRNNNFTKNVSVL